ncbi:hypothetical protein [Brevundimonas sp.]|uniref:hypothetical protein n=1 Tax=Brevundimonas sp. TaxID=1871086 RepID=UPI002ED9BE14
MRAAFGLIALVMLAACEGGGDPVEQALRETAAANHSAATRETASAEPAPPATPAVCDIEVTFGSYGGGVDGDLREAVSALTRNDPGVIEAENKPWGREGESTLCIRTKDEVTANRIYGTIAAQIPQTSTRAPTSVRHRDGRSRASTYPTAS